MRIQNTLESKKIRIGIVLAIVLLIAGAFVFKMLHQPTITTYKDEQSIIYDCSQPIKAKKGTVPSLGGGRMDALVPADQNGAKRYCRASGIE